MQRNGRLLRVNTRTGILVIGHSSMSSGDRALQVDQGAASDRGEVIAEQILLAGVVTVRIRRVIVPEPAAYAAGYVGDEGPFGTSGDVGPGVTEGTVSVTASDVPVMSLGHVISPRADAYI
jgi:hypothetical protein